MAQLKPTKYQPLEPLPIERLAKPFAMFAKQAGAGGIVLLACAVLAMLWANSPAGRVLFPPLVHPR
jgi:Na+/H+ antiporter NhaA